MIVTDYNMMEIRELQIINRCLGIEFNINDGRIERKDKNNELRDSDNTGLHR